MHIPDPRLLSHISMANKGRKLYIHVFVVFIRNLGPGQVLGLVLSLVLLLVLGLSLVLGLVLGLAIGPVLGLKA